MATGMRAREAKKKEAVYGHSICFLKKCEHRIKDGGCNKIGKKYFNAHDWYSVHDGFCLAE